MPDYGRQQLQSKTQMLLEQLSASPCSYTEFDTLLMPATTAAAITDGCLWINECQKPVLSFKCNVLHTLDTHIAHSLPQQAFLMAFVFSTRWFCSHPFFHCLSILNIGFNISVRGASTSKGIGGGKQRAMRYRGKRRPTRAAHTASAGHTPWVPLGSAGRARAHH